MVFKIEFLKDFAGYKKGKCVSMDSSLASSLILKGVAKRKTETKRTRK